MTMATTPGPSLPPPHFSLLLAKAIRQQILFLPAAKASRQERQRSLVLAAGPEHRGRPQVAAWGSPCPGQLAPAVSPGREIFNPNSGSEHQRGKARALPGHGWSRVSAGHLGGCQDGTDPPSDPSRAVLALSSVALPLQVTLLRICRQKSIFLYSVKGKGKTDEAAQNPPPGRRGCAGGKYCS